MEKMTKEEFNKFFFENIDKEKLNELIEEYIASNLNINIKLNNEDGRIQSSVQLNLNNKNISDDYDSI